MSDPFTRPKYMYICRFITAVCSKLTDWRCSSAESALDCIAAFSGIGVESRWVNFFSILYLFLFMYSNLFYFATFSLIHKSIKAT